MGEAYHHPSPIDSALMRTIQREIDRHQRGQGPPPEFPSSAVNDFWQGRVQSRSFVATHEPMDEEWLRILEDFGSAEVVYGDPSLVQEVRFGPAPFDLDSAKREMVTYSDRQPFEVPALLPPAAPASELHRRAGSAAGRPDFHPV
jgi:hypothetical protein